MRNIFDQYDQPENRLSHALAVCLSEDVRLLKRFLQWIEVTPAPPGARLAVVEQRLPGERRESIISHAEIRDRGLPDITIFDRRGTWCMLIESKIESGLTFDQLNRHRRTLRHRGYLRVIVVTLTKRVSRRHANTHAVCWCDLYSWLGTFKNVSSWAVRLREYLEVAELTMIRDGYLRSGTLTAFDGFPIDEVSPYTYGDAKRRLKLAMPLLRKDRRLARLGIEPRAAGRSAITGRESSAVWDYLALKHPRKGLAFTQFPHLTLAVSVESLEVAITIPNGVIRSVRRNLASLDENGFRDLNNQILKNARKLILKGASVEAYALQRHYTSQRAKPSLDAKLWYKLETSQPSGGRGIKHQPHWGDVFARVLTERRSNTQFGYIVRFPWGYPGLNERKSLDLIIDGWCALEPLVRVIRSGPRAS